MMEFSSSRAALATWPRPRIGLVDWDSPETAMDQMPLLVARGGRSWTEPMAETGMLLVLRPWVARPRIPSRVIVSV